MGKVFRILLLSQILFFCECQKCALGNMYNISILGILKCYTLVLVLNT